MLIVLISSGESLCIMLFTRSVVLKRCLGIDVAADNRLIIVVLTKRLPLLPLSRESVVGGQNQAQN